MDSASAINKELGLAIRVETIAILKSNQVKEALRHLQVGQSATELTSIIPKWICEAVLHDLQIDENWNEEFWQIDTTGNVSPVSNKEFWKSDEPHRFSWNECLRHPHKNAFCVRGFLSTLVADNVAITLSEACGEQVNFRSVDIARYKQNQYLRRHADIFEDRRFGLVFFLGDGWQQGCGGELIVEANTGASVVIPPKQGTMAIILIKPDYFHQVAFNRSGTWTRYSIASHYHRVF